MTGRLRRLAARLHEFNVTQVELHERLLLSNRPWEEEYLHWAYDGQHRWLHGHLPPPPGRHRPAATVTAPPVPAGAGPATTSSQLALMRVTRTRTSTEGLSRRPAAGSVTGHRTATGALTRRA